MKSVMMKIAWAYWKYWSAFSCSTLLVFVFLSHMSSQFLFHGDPPIATKVTLKPERSYDIKLSEASNGSAPIQSCEGRRIYMYDLPAKFNSQLLQNCSGKLVSWLDFCKHIENQGFGSSIRNRTGWYATDLYMLEVVFHNRMKKYQCLVSDPGRADAFYIPYYIGVDALRYLYGNERDRASDHGAELVSWLDKNAKWSWTKRGGMDHFMVTGRTAWDLSKPPMAKGNTWGTSLLELPAMANVTTLLVESRTWIEREQAVPYLTSFHPSSLRELKAWTDTVVSARRDFLFAFVGAGRQGLGIRRAVIEQCRHSSSKCVMVNCAEMKCSHMPDAVMKELLKANFCLQPPGDSPTRRSTFDGLIAGCIPVFFRRDSAYEQYTWHLPSDPETYSVFIAEEKLLNSKKPLKIEDVLSSYSQEKIRRMREKIVEIIPSLLYMNFEEKGGGDGENFPKDAFDLSVEGMLSKAMSYRFWNRL